MKNRHLQFIGLTFVLAVTLTFFKVPIASSQGQTLSAAFVSGELPVLDPGSELWQNSRPLQVPLSAQQISRPLALATRTRSVTARSLHNDAQIAILVEWEDATQNDTTIRVQDFSDMVALQFPVSEGQPFFCMGQEGGNVEIWLWKSDWQADITARRDVEAVYQDMYVDEMDPVGDPAAADATTYFPALQAGNLSAKHTRLSPVENLVAGGFGSLTTLPEDAQQVQGYGEWANGKWSVIFSRDMSPTGSELASFQPGKTYSLAFAAWDGAFYERNGQKSTSQWVSMQLNRADQATQVQEAAAATVPFWQNRDMIVTILTGMVLFFLLLVAVIYFRLPGEN